MCIVHLLHGIPGSGKTSFAKQLEMKANTVRLSHDEWMVALFGSDPAMDQWERYSARIDGQLWVMAERLIRADVDVVMDFGFWSRRSRDEARSRIASFGATPMLYKFACSQELALSRVLARYASPESGVLHIDAAAFHLLAAKLEPLGEDEPHQAVTLEDRLNLHQS